MDDHQVGAAIRSIRQRKRWRQEDLATKARVSRSTVGRIERGALSNVPLGTIRMGETEGKTFYEITEASQPFGWRTFDFSALEA